MSVEVHGLDPLFGDTAFAFFVVRMKQAVERDALIAMLRYVAPLIADSDAFIDQLPADLEQSVRILAMPWVPPEAGHAVDAQRRLIESAGALGVEAAWFFQTGTSLPTEDDDDHEDHEDDDDGDDDDRDAVGDEDEAPSRARTKTDRASRAMTLDDHDEPGEPSWGNQLSWATGEVTGVTKTTPIDIVDLTGEHGALDDGDDADRDLEAERRDAAASEGWTYGPPPQVATVRFPVDGYPAIVGDLDWEDVGIAVKLAGDMLPGEGTVLLAFHTLWLAPYGGRYRNAAVTVDRVHHAAHLWVDRFAVPCSTREQVQHLLWVLAKLDEVIPIVHARFAPASMAQKYAGLVDDDSEPFVLGGNPLLPIHAEGGEAAVDAWIAAQTTWSNEEVAHMLRELAIEIVTAGAGDAGGEVDARCDAAGEVPPAQHDEEDDEGDDDDEEDDDDDESEDDEDDDDEAEGNEDDDRGRQITGYAGELLVMRARAGLLDARAADALLPVLAAGESSAPRRAATVRILGALRHRAAAPALIEILDATTRGRALDAIDKDDAATAAAAALGAIGDPAAIPALSRVVAAPATHDDRRRSVAADALATCLAAAPEPRHVEDGVLAGLLATIRERNDAELNAESQLAYGRIVHQLPPDRRADARRQLASCDSARDDAVALLARQAALLLASPTSPIDPPPRDLAPLLHESLTSLDYDHDYTARNLRVALRVAAIVPELVAVDDLVWLTRFTEPDIRAAAHALLARLGKPIAPAALYDRLSTHAVDDGELVRAIGEAHIVGRAALIAEAGRRDLQRARRAIIDACHDVVSRARPGGESLLDPDTRVLEAAVPLLCDQPLDDDVVALFDRMLRHSNYHVKWELLQNPPHDERLIGGMFQVVGEKWGWQEKTAKTWLEAFAGTPAYELERKRAPVREDHDDDVTEAHDLDDEDMN